MSDDEDDLIESNSSENNTPPLSYNRDVLNDDDTNEPHYVMRPVSFDELFERFVQANSSKSICKSFEQIVQLLNINTQQVFESGYTFPALNQGNNINSRFFTSNSNYYFQQYQQQQSNSTSCRPTRLVYQIIKSKTNYWKSNDLWKKYDKRAGLKDYQMTSKTSSNCKDLNVLIIGCGPAGLRLSIELALLGFRCTIIEKRDRFSRNNVLHLWPYTIADLKNLGAKLFYGKFCAGSIDHISIRKLQCILLKAALLMGVQVHFNTSFEEIIEPNGTEQLNTSGWRVRFLPENHPLAQKTFDVVIGADGRRNSLPGFVRKEFRGRLAIGITANFVNYCSAEEAEVQERSGVAFIFDQKFFLDLRQETNIDLENIVYYKDDTHYFVMTAKKQSLIEKGVIKQDYQDAAKLLSKENVNFDALCDYAKLAAYVSTNRKLRTLDFAKNHYGQPDVAMFDFTSLFQSENATRIIERKGRHIFMSLVGDSLLEPFWPLGTGIARGFLAAFDTAWAIKRYAMNTNPLEVLWERESIFQLLSQTTHDNVSKNYQEYTIDPTTRYVNLKIKPFQEKQIRHLYDDGTKPLSSIENSITLEKRMKSEFVQSDTLLRWCQIVVQPYGIRIENFTSSWKDGLAFCAIIHRFRSDLIEYNSLSENTSAKNINLLFDVMHNKLGLGSGVNSEELIKNGVANRITVLMILDKLYSVFKNNQINEVDVENVHDTRDELLNNKRKISTQPDDHPVILRKQLNRSKPVENSSSTLATSKDLPVRRNSLKNIDVSNLANILKSKFEPQYSTNQQSNQTNQPQLSNIISSYNNQNAYYPTAATNNVVVKQEHLPQPQPQQQRPKSSIQHFSFPSSIPTRSSFSFQLSSERETVQSNQSAGFYLQSICHECGNKVSIMERQNVLHLVLHTQCFKCSVCRVKLDSSSYEHQIDSNTRKYLFYCTKHKPVNIYSPSKVFDEQDYLSKVTSSTTSSSSGERYLNDASRRTNDDLLKKSYDTNLLRPTVSTITNRHSYNAPAPKSDIENKFNDFSATTSKPTYKMPERAEFEFEVHNQYEEEDDYEDDDDYEDTGDGTDSDELTEEEEEDEEELEEEEVKKAPSVVGHESDDQSDDDSDEYDSEENEDNEEVEEEVNEEDLKNEQQRILQVFQDIENDIDEMKNSRNSDSSTSTNSKPDEQVNKFETKTPELRLKKFNLTPSINTSSTTKTEDLVEKHILIDQQRKHDMLKVQNDLEKNKNLLRELLYEKTNGDATAAKLKNTVFTCQMCKSPASITQRTRIQGVIFHRDCIRCATCGVIVRNAESLSQKGLNNQIYFYCSSHFVEKKAEIKQENDDETNDLSKEEEHQQENDGSDFSTCSCSESTTSSKSSKRQEQKQEVKKTESLKSSLKSLNIGDSSEIKKLDGESLESSRCTSNMSNHTYSQLSPTSSTSPIEMIPTREVTNKTNPMPILAEQSKILLDCQLMRQRALEKARLKSDEELGVKIPNNIKRLIMPISSLNKEADFKSNISNENSIRKIELVATRTEEGGKKFESKTETDSENDDIDYPAPLAKSETFEDEIKKNYSTSPASSSSLSTSPLSKRQSFKVKITKLLSPTSSVSPSARSTKSPSPTTPLSLAKKFSSSGILKSIFNSRPSSKYAKESEFKVLSEVFTDDKLDLSGDCDGDDLNTSDSCSSLSNEGSFNTLNVTNSPRLSRHSRTAKLNQKRQENEEKKLEKQRHNKRLRMSQEIQRKLDEIETKSSELEQAGVDLERIICSIDSNDSSKSETKQKLEQELYNIIHQRNLLTRFENELNIQTRALAIEDKLSECKQKLRETINLPESDKSTQVMENEKKTMEKIVEYVEEKNQLVEQLESLRLLEREEDSEITRVFSGKIFNFDRELDLLNKFEPYQDII